MIVRLALGYLGYFIASGFWSNGLSLEAFAGPLRVSLLLLLFLAMTLHLVDSDARFAGRLFFWIAIVAGTILLVVFAAAVLGLLTFGALITDIVAAQERYDTAVAEHSAMRAGKRRRAHAGMAR